MKSFQQEWTRVNLVQQCMPDMSISDQCSGHWELDGRMRAALKPYIEQYEQGLIHSMEFVAAIVDEVNRLRD